MVKTRTINQMLKKAIEALGEGDYFNPLLDAQILLAFLLDVDRVYLYAHGDQLLSEELIDEYMKLIELRSKRYPIQYIIGRQEFMGLDFKVAEGVLVPRADTEVLVEKIIEISKGDPFNSKHLNIVDIGTGSGAITLSLAHYIKDSSLYSVDISQIALSVAKDNAKALKLEDRVKFLKGSLLEPLNDEDLYKKVDILVSNPPYIPSKTIEDLQAEVSTYEPKLALDGGEDGLDFYRAIVKQSLEFLADTSIIAFEIGYDQASAVTNLLVDTGHFKSVETVTDLSGTDRVIIAYRH